MTSNAAPPRRGGVRHTDRRAEILDVATRVFYEKGYDGTSIQDIADELQILKGSLYHYIRSKEDLLVQILEEGHERMRANLEATRVAEGPALTTIGDFVERHVLVHLENFRAARIFVHDLNAVPADSRRHIVELRDEYELAFRTLVDRGMRDGTVCTDIDSKLEAKALLTMLNSIHLWYRPEGRLPAPVIAQQYGDLVVAALRCDPSTHHPGHRRARPGKVATDGASRRRRPRAART